MDKNKKKAKMMLNDLATKFNGKILFIQHSTSKYYVDSNNSGDLYLNNNERVGFQKWEFQNTDIPGNYYIKNSITGLYLNSNEFGELYCYLFNPFSSYQMWKVHLTTEANFYVILNVGNDLALTANKFNKIMLYYFDKIMFDQLDTNVSYLLYAKKPEKR